MIAGSGNVVTESRVVAEFDRIDLAGEGLVLVTIGDGYSLSLETDDNLMSYLDGSVAGNTLTMRTVGTGSLDIDPTDSITWRVEVPRLVAVTISGAGSIEVPNSSGDRMAATIGGAGDIRLPGLAVGHLAAAITGAGTIVASGSADSVDLVVEAVGTIDAADLESATASVATGTPGSITLWVTDEIEILGSGLGSISVYGSPRVIGDTDRVTSLGDK
jgi:hypothetical protein